MFRPAPERRWVAVAGGKGGGLCSNPVPKFKMLVLQALHGLPELDAVQRTWARR